MRTKQIAALAAPLLAVTLLAPGTARADGGTITGRVTAMPAKYLPETVVYVDHTNEKLTPRTANVDQQGMAFVPHVRAIAVGDTVKFENHDHVSHNVFSPEGGFNLGVWGFGESREHTFTKTGTFTLLCALHPEMLGYVFVGQNRHAAVVDAQGGFTLTGVPPGTYQVKVWNSHLKAPAQTVTVRAGGTATLAFALRR